MQNTEIAIRQAPTPEQIELIKKTVAVGATDDELKLFLYQAGKRGLDPLTRQIHFIKRKRYNAELKTYEDVGTIQTGIDGFRLIADRTKKLAGIKRGVIKNDKGELLSAWAEVYRSDWKEPAREEVSFKEYCQRNKDGEPISLWRTMPETMLKKVAEAAALRMAFPEDLSGLYSDDELDQAENSNGKTEVATIPNPAPIGEPLLQTQKTKAMPSQVRVIEAHRKRIGDDKFWTIAHEMKIQSTADLDADQAAALIGALANVK